MNLFGIGSILKSVGGIADDLVTTEEEERRIDLDEKRLDAEMARGQLEVNRVEAGHRSMFVAGWRPFIGWTCGAAFCWHFVLLPIAALALTAAGVPVELPAFDISTLSTVLMGLLGLGGLRTYEKLKGLTR